MSFDPLTKVAIGVATIPTALAGGSIGMISSISPSAGKVSKTHETMIDLKKGLADRLSTMIKSAVQTSVGRLREDLAYLKQQASATEEKFNSQLRDNSEHLVFRLQGIKEELLSSIKKDGDDLKEKLQQITNQLKDSENKLESQLNTETLITEQSIGSSLDKLTELIEERVKSSQEPYLQLLNRVKEELFNLERDLTPEVKTYKCTVKLNTVRTHKSKTLKTTESKTWGLEEFLKLVKDQENKKSYLHDGKVPTASELARDIKAKCFGISNDTEVKVNEKFGIYELDK